MQFCSYLLRYYRIILANLVYHNLWVTFTVHVLLPHLISDSYSFNRLIIYWVCWINYNLTEVWFCFLHKVRSMHQPGWVVATGHRWIPVSTQIIWLQLSIVCQNFLVCVVRVFLKGKVEVLEFLDSCKVCTSWIKHWYISCRAWVSSIYSQEAN